MFKNVINLLVTEEDWRELIPKERDVTRFTFSSPTTVSSYKIDTIINSDSESEIHQQLNLV